MTTFTDPAEAGKLICGPAIFHACAPLRLPPVLDELSGTDEDMERYIHFHGRHVQDPPAHGDQCADSCPYDTPAQARERAELAAYAEAREAECAAEYE